MKHHILVALSLLLWLGSCGTEKKNTRTKPSPNLPLAKETTLAPGAVWTASKRASIKMNWNGAILAEQFLSGTLTFYDDQAQAASIVENIEFIPDMPSMGHGTDMEDQKYETVSPGVVKITGIYLIMGGPWRITIKAKINGKDEVAEMEIDVP